MGLLNPKYPNLELIEYKFQQLLMKDENWKGKVEKLRESNRYLPPAFSVTVFTQTWGAPVPHLMLCRTVALQWVAVP